MADVDVEATEQEEKPKPRPRPKPKKAKGSGGNVGTIVAAVVALAAIIMCALLFMQMQNMKKQLGEAGIAMPAGLGGETAMAAEGDGEGDEGHGDAHGEDPYDWQSDPKEDIIYPLEKFTRNTSDGKFAVMTLSLLLTSGITAHDRQVYQVQLDNYNMQLEEYTHAVEEWRDKNEITLAPPRFPSRCAEDAPLVAAGMFLLMHGGAPVETGPPEPPEYPEEPRTILEQKLAEKNLLVREKIGDEINIRTSAELMSPEGRESFKTAVVEEINSMFDRHYGTVTDLIVSEVVVQ